MVDLTGVGVVEEQLLEHFGARPLRLVGAERLVGQHLSILPGFEPGLPAHLIGPPLDVPLRLGGNGASEALERRPLPAFPMRKPGEVAHTEYGLGGHEGT